MKFFLVAFLAIYAYVAAEDECNLRELLRPLIEDRTFYHEVQTCIDKSGKDNLQTTFNDMDKVATAVDAKYDDNWETLEGDADEEWKEIYANVKIIRGYLETLQKDMPECTFINDSITEICDIEKKCD